VQVSNIYGPAERTPITVMITSSMTAGGMTRIGRGVGAIL
jgi:hypothetical protein